MKKVLRRFAPALLAVLFASLSWGQSTSQLTGTVTDTTGAVIEGASVRASSVSTGAERSTVTNDSGNYNIPFLPPGGYTINVQRDGFRAVNRENVLLEVNQTARIDFSLEVGAVTETIEVTDAPPILESESSSVGQVIGTKPIIDLPLNGRNFVQLAILSPGVVGVGFGARGTIMSGTRPDDLRPGSEIFSNGNREGANNFLMDGVDNNERLTLAIVLRPSVESVQEFKIQTNLFAAEQGRNPGATVNVVTKSGTNEYHGSAYEFLRNDAFDAREYFARPDAATPAFRQNQFGATLGGKIVENKLFFFGAYEGFRRRRENTSVNGVPTLAMRGGDFSAVRDVYDPFTTVAVSSSTSQRTAFTNRQIPVGRFDSVMGRVAQAYPLPQTAGLTNNHVSNPKERQGWDQGDVRMDWNASDGNVIFGRYSRQDTTTTRPSTFLPTTIPGLATPVSLGSEASFAGDSDLKAHNAVLAWVHTFTPTFLMDARMGFNRFDLNFLQEGATPGAKLGEALGVRNSNQGPASDGIPIFSPGDGYQGIGQTRSLPIIRIENTFHPIVNLTNIRGAHTIKFGFDGRRRQVTQFQTNRGNGRYNFSRTFTNSGDLLATTGDSIASLLLGTASVIEQDFTLVFPGIRGTEYGYYLQDDWKVSDRLTLNIGLRYEYFTPFTEVADRWTNFDVVTGKLLIAGFNTDSATGIKNDRNNLAPRFGFAYRAREGTVLRGGYGVFYNTPGSESVMMRRHRQLPFGPINVVDINQFSPNPQRVQDGLAPIPVLDFDVVANNPVGSMLAVAEEFAAGYAQQFNLQLQQDFGAGTVLKLGYVGNLGHRIDTSYDYNQAVPGPGAAGPRRPLFSIAPGVVGATYNVSDGNATYHALQFSAERRFSGNFGFLGSYTWAHSIDDNVNSFGGADNGPSPQDRRNRAAERSNSGFDLRHRFVLSANYTLPVGKGQAVDFQNGIANNVLGGWKMNLIFTAQTGLPFTPTLNSSVSNAGGSRPERFKEGTLEDPTRVRWFDTSFNTADAAWGVPATFTFGNAGRNILFGPGRVNFDYSLFKDLALTERWNLQLRAEFFNLMNTPQFDLPNAAIGGSNAGIISSVLGNPRQIQFGLRLSF